MKRFIGSLLAMLLCLLFPLSVGAAELISCSIRMDSATGAPGEIVTVTVSIGDNLSFTNFSMGLDYNPAHLTLKHVEIDDSYLCGQQAAVNEVESGLVVTASAEPVRGNGILFRATFEIAADFTGETQVTPVVRYMRNNEAIFSVFEEIQPTVTGGTVHAVLTGDVNGDGIIEYNDVMLAYKAFLAETELTPEQLAVVDTNGNGTVEEAEYQAIYQIYLGGSV